MIKNQFELEYEEKIKNNIKKIKNVIKSTTNEKINVMAVTKNIKAEFVNVAIREGVKLIGENKVQELVEKYDKYEKDDVKIHFIGHLQTNKVKKIINLVDCIESVDSIKLATTISKYAEKINKIIPIFLEINIGKEEQKFGFNPEEILENLNIISKMPNIKINGLMTIPPKKNVSQSFKEMNRIYVDISNKNIDNVNMKFLSMGMSEDFKEAIICGANLIRIGKLIFN